MSKEELQKILELHTKYLNNEENGKRANLSDANLSDADLRGAKLKNCFLPFYIDLKEEKENV